MAQQQKQGIDFGTIGIWFGIAAVVLTLVAVAVMKVFTGDRADDITWVG